MQELHAGTWLNMSLLAGGGLSGTLYYMFQHHPDDPSRPLIDYRLSLVLTPSVLVGSTVGASLTWPHKPAHARRCQHRAASGRRSSMCRDSQVLV